MRHITARGRLWLATSLATCVLATLGAGTARAQGTSEAYFGAFYKPVCDKLIPGFESATKASYVAWEHRNHDAVTTLEANPEFRAKRREALVTPPADIAAAKTQELSGTCERLGSLFESAEPAEERFAAPERTWESFRRALREANRDKLQACLTGNARKNFTAQLLAMTDAQLKRMGDSIAELKLAQRNGAFQEALVLQRDGRAGTVSFIKTGDNWKIAEM